MASIYEVLRDAGCTLDSHESDLYVLATEEARRLTEGQPSRSFFTDSEGKQWVEIPFAFDPWWEGRKKEKA